MLYLSSRTRKAAGSFFYNQLDNNEYPARKVFFQKACINQILSSLMNVVNY